MRYSIFNGKHTVLGSRLDSDPWNDMYLYLDSKLYPHNEMVQKQNIDGHNCSVNIDKQAEFTGNTTVLKFRGQGTLKKAGMNAIWQFIFKLITKVKR